MTKHQPIKIESGIPLPPPRKTTGVMAAFRKMKIGDSFMWYGRSINNIYVFARRAGVKISVRKQEKGFRIFRVSNNQRQAA